MSGLDEDWKKTLVECSRVYSRDEYNIVAKIKSGKSECFWSENWIGEIVKSKRLSR